MSAPRQITVTAVPGIPLIAPDDDIGNIIIAAMDTAGLQPRVGTIAVIAQKIVSKAQGRYVDLAAVTPSERARELAAVAQKDPRLVEVILSESVRVVRCQPRVLIVEHRSGYIAANAGIDRSNVGPTGESDMVLLLPRDPHGTAAELRRKLEEHFGVALGVIISDSFGRPWRRGTVGVALASAGISALNDLRGRPDLFGRTLEVTETAMADEVASAASLLMGQADEAQPVVLVSGFETAEREIPASALIRPKSEDLFR